VRITQNGTSRAAWFRLRLPCSLAVY